MSDWMGGLMLLLAIVLAGLMEIWQERRKRQWREDQRQRTLARLFDDAKSRRKVQG